MLRKLPPYIEELGRTCLFHDLSKRELAAVQQLGTVVDRQAGEVLCRRGHGRGQVGIVIAGEVAAVTATGGRRHLRDGACFGTLSTVASEAELEQVEAVTPVTVFVVGRREFPALREVCPRLATRLAGAADVAATTRWTQTGSWRSHTVTIAT